MASPLHKLNFHEFEQEKLDLLFTQSLVDAVQVKYPGHDVSDRAIYSSGFCSCVGIVIFGKNSVVLSHYDTPESDKVEQDGMVSLIEKNNKQLLIAREKKDFKKVGYLESKIRYFSELKQEKHLNLDTSEYIQQMKSYFNSQDLFAVVMGGRVNHSYKAMRELRRQGITVVGSYMRNTQTYTCRDLPVNISGQQDIYDRNLFSIDQYSETTMIGLLNPKQVIIKHGLTGLIRIVLENI